MDAQLCEYTTPLFKKYLFILAVPGLSCSMWDLLVAACMWDLVPQSGSERGPPALGEWSLTHWTTTEVPILRH